MVRAHLVASSDSECLGHLPTVCLRRDIGTDHEYHCPEKRRTRTSEMEGEEGGDLQGHSYAANALI